MEQQFTKMADAGNIEAPESPSLTPTTLTARNFWRE